MFERDGACRFPGWGSRRLLHGHHIVHWARGGPTDVANLVLPCGHHHRLVHESGYTVHPNHGDASRGVTFTRPDATPIPDHPHRALPQERTR